MGLGHGIWANPSYKYSRRTCSQIVLTRVLSQWRVGILQKSERKRVNGVGHGTAPRRRQRERAKEGAYIKEVHKISDPSPLHMSTFVGSFLQLMLYRDGLKYGSQVYENQVRNCILLQAADRKTQLFLLILTGPGNRTLAHW